MDAIEITNVSGLWSGFKHGSEHRIGAAALYKSLDAGSNKLVSK